MERETLGAAIRCQKRPASGTEFASNAFAKGNNMAASRRMPAMSLSLISPQEPSSFTTDPGTVSFSGSDAAPCVASDRFCPMAEAFYEKQRTIDELQERLGSTEDRVKHLGDLAKLGELSAVVAHEIRNPLAGISATAEMLLDDLPQDDPRHESIRIILDEIQRLDKTVRNLLDFARSHKPFITRVDLREEVERVLERVRHGAKEQNVVISGVCPRDLPDAKADPELVRQAFLHVALNAIQAMPGGGELNVSLLSDADERGRCVKAAFTDTGCGISPENLAKIFDPFFTTKANGAGLGLAVTRKIIEAQNGSVLVESSLGSGSAFGSGSTFTIVLPAAET